MRKIDEKEFNSLVKDIPREVVNSCNHPEVVRIYTMGAHTDYGCLKCGLQHTNKEVFDKPGLEGWR